MILIYRGSITFILLLNYRRSVPRIKQEILSFLKKTLEAQESFFLKKTLIFILSIEKQLENKWEELWEDRLEYFLSIFDKTPKAAK